MHTLGAAHVGIGSDMYGLPSSVMRDYRDFGRCMELLDQRGLNAEEAERLATDQAIRQSETQIFEAVEENLPDGEEESEWNWGALANFANARWKTKLTDWRR